MSRGDDGPAQRAILLERTAALARVEEPPVTALEPAVFFRVGRQSCCALARSVRGAIPLDDLVPVPHAGRSLAGALARNGAAIPVFHLAALVGDRIGRLPETAQALLLGASADEVALAVDAVDGFGDVALAEMRDPPGDVRSRWITRATANGELLVDLEAMRDAEVLWVDLRLTRTE